MNQVLRDMCGDIVNIVTRNAPIHCKESTQIFDAKGVQMIPDFDSVLQIISGNYL